MENVRKALVGVGGAVILGFGSVRRPYALFWRLEEQL